MWEWADICGLSRCRDAPEAEEVVIQLKKSGYNVIREDASFTVFAPPEGCPSREKLQAEVRLKPSQAEADVVRDVRERSTACANHFTFRLNSPLTKQPGQSAQQTLAMEGLFRTLKVRDTDTSEWARVEVTCMKWNISPATAAGENSNVQPSLSPPCKRANHFSQQASCEGSEVCDR